MKHKRHFNFKFPKLSKEDKIFYTTVGVLGASALVFGGLIIAPYVSMPKSSAPTTISSRADVSTEAPVASEGGKVIDPPAQDASKEELSKYFQKINAMAKDTSELVIEKGCVANPPYPRLVVGDVLTIKNSDSISHDIQLNPENSPSLAPGESVKVKTDFKMGYGIYSFGCDRGPRLAGALILTPKH